MNPTKEKVESREERFEYQIKSKPNQPLEFSMTRDNKISIVLKPVQARTFVTDESFVTDTTGNLRVFE